MLVEMAQSINQTHNMLGLERLGGFGGIADRLNSYNHYLGNPDYLQQDIQRYRAVTPAAVQTFAREQLPANARVVLRAVPGEPAAQTAVPTPGASGPSGAGAGGGEAINANEDWRLKMP